MANNFSKKGVGDFLALANDYPQLNFHLVGEGKKSKNSLSNLTYHGKLSRYELSELLKNMQLHVFHHVLKVFQK